MSHIIRPHTIPWLKGLTQKARKRKAKKDMIKKASFNLETTYHAEERLQERFAKIKNENIRKDRIWGIVSWRIKYNVWLKTYKIYWNKGIYIMWTNKRIITAYTENTWSGADKYYTWLSKENRKNIINELWISLDN